MNSFLLKTQGGVAADFWRTILCSFAILTFNKSTTIKSDYHRIVVILVINNPLFSSSNYYSLHVHGLHPFFDMLCFVVFVLQYRYSAFDGVMSPFLSLCVFINLCAVVYCSVDAQGHLSSVFSYEHFSKSTVFSRSAYEQKIWFAPKGTACIQA